MKEMSAKVDRKETDRGRMYEGWDERSRCSLLSEEHSWC